MLWIILCVSVSLSILFIITSVMQLYRERFLWNAILFFCCLFLLLEAQMTLTVLYTAILHSICMQFRLLNRSIANYAKLPWICERPAHVDEMAIIDRWSKIHDDLTDAVLLINKCFSLSVGIPSAEN